MRMRSLITLGLSAALGVLGTGVSRGQAPPVELKVGDIAPAFSLVGSDGKTHTLAESSGKQVVVLAWFPKAFTGG